LNIFCITRDHFWSYVMVCISVALLMPAPGLAEPSSWDADISNHEGRLSVGLSDYQRYGRPTLRLGSYAHPFLTLLEQADETITRLSLDRPSLMTIAPEPVFEMTYEQSSMVWSHSEAGLLEVKQQLYSDIDLLFEADAPIRIEKGDPLAQFLNILDGDRTMFNAFIRLFPLFDSFGLRLASSLAEQYPGGFLRSAENMKRIVRTKSHGELDNLYNDSWRNHGYSTLKKRLSAEGRSRQLSWMEAVHTRFSMGFVQQRLRLQFQARQGEGSQKKSIFVQKIPPLLALKRGLWVGDCCRKSVPMYPLIPGVEVHGFWSDTSLEEIENGAMPDGYALLMHFQEGDKSVPYFITLNSSTATTSDFISVLRGGRSLCSLCLGLGRD
ncbi:MAG: hypothetical protein AAF202_08855, partial [Pseudomonadota bacterium]